MIWIYFCKPITHHRQLLKPLLAERNKNSHFSAVQYFETLDPGVYVEANWQKPSAQTLLQIKRSPVKAHSSHTVRPTGLCVLPC